MGAAGPDRGDGGRASDKTCWCSDPESTLDKLLKYEKRRTRGDFEWNGKKGREDVGRRRVGTQHPGRTCIDSMLSTSPPK